MIEVKSFQIMGNYIIVPYTSIEKVIEERLKPDPSLIMNKLPEFDYSRIGVLLFDEAVFYRSDVKPWERAREWQRLLDGDYGVKLEYWSVVDCDDFADFFKSWLTFRFRENCYLRCYGQLEVRDPDGNTVKGYHAFNAWIWLVTTPDNAKVYAEIMIVEPQLNAWLIPDSNGVACLEYYDREGKKWELRYRIGGVIL